MSETQKIWADYSTGLISEKKAVNLLLELLFIEKNDFGLSGFDEDTFSEFILFMAGRFKVILRKFNPELSEFNTYLHSIINMTASWWRKKIWEDNLKDFCSIKICIEEELTYRDYSPKERSFYVEEPENLALVPSSYNAQTIVEKLYSAMKKQKGITSGKIIKMIKILALKSCNNISDEQVDVISEITGIKKSSLNNLIRQAEESLIIKKDRFSVLRNRRNYAWFQRRKNMIIREHLKSSYPEVKNEKSITEINKNEKKWKKTSDELWTMAPFLVPSNITVGRLLNIKPRTVHKMLEKVKEKLDSNIVNRPSE
ncbi:MAG: hypothetical protein SPJ89_00270 [Treponema sp.]|nr:hypothetical protein [Spirochaetia bacterium]MDD7459354.1 hypothetical protein [Spirochaetales bacterium]MDY5810396.1 hypothetical protein [Treponema sp.]